MDSMITIGVLQTGYPPENLKAQHGDYAAMIEQLLSCHEFDFKVWNVIDNSFPETVEACDGWIITGSRHSVNDAFPWIPKLEQLIRSSNASHAPMAGICFGHQIIAKALGGRVERNADGWTVGTQSYTFLNEDIDLNAWHGEHVVQLPAGSEVLGSSSTCRFAMVKFSPCAVGIQAHPEFRHDFVEGLIRERGRGVVPDELLHVAEDRLGRPLDQRKVADWLRDFYTAALSL